MTRKNKSLSRCYLCSYIAWIFGSWVPALLASKWNGGLAIVFVVLAIISLAALIVSHVFKNKNMSQIFFYTGFSSIALLTILVILGLVFEIILTASNEMAPWPWMAGGVSIALMGLAFWLMFKGYKKYKHPDLVI